MAWMSCGISPANQMPFHEAVSAMPSLADEICDTILSAVRSSVAGFVRNEPHARADGV